MKLVFGIDPGIANTGWSLVSKNDTKRFEVRASGCITTPTTLTESQRLHRIYEEVSLLVFRYSPTHITVENVYFNTNKTSALSTCAVAAICQLAGEIAGIHVSCVSPQQAKSAVSGNTRASKADVVRFVEKLTQRKAKSSHEADAIAIAIAGMLAAKSLRVRPRK